MKIYISGKISGEPTAQCTMKFGTMQKCIENLGHQAVNPLELCMSEKDITWLDAMRKDIKAMMECDAIYCMPDYIHSRGALLEQQIMIALDLPVFYDLKTLGKHTPVVKMNSKMNGQ